MTDSPLRRASGEDRAEIGALERLCSVMPWPVTEIEKTLRLDTTWAWISTDCYLLSSVVEPSAEILILGVRPCARRAGLGRALLQHAMQAWRCQGVRDAHLEVRADNGPARALYEALDWFKTGRRARYYPGGEDAIVYSCTLSPVEVNWAGS